LTSPKTIRAWAFSLTHLETGDVLGIAMVCAEARYLTALWANGQRFRHFATLEDWQTIERELYDGFKITPLPADSRLQVLTLNADANVHLGYLNARDVTIDAGKDVVAALDDALRAHTVAW
jgi:hypothetical protein